MITIAKEIDINNINKIGKLMYDNFENTYNIKNYLQNKNYIIIVNKSFDILNGFMIVYKNIDYYELELIIVSKEYRNQGIATKMMNYFFDNYCETKNEILLEVSCENANAIRLYKKFDFEQISIRKKYYGNIDAYIMKKVIK